MDAKDPMVEDCTAKYVGHHLVSLQIRPGDADRFYYTHSMNIYIDKHPINCKIEWTFERNGWKMLQ